MNIYVFGNPDVAGDNKAIQIAKKLEGEMAGINFIYHDPNEEFDPEDKDLVILDTAIGIDEVRIIENLDSVKLSPKVSMHDFDIGMQLKLLEKLGKIKSVKIVAIPLSGEIDAYSEQLFAVLKNLEREG